MTVERRNVPQLFAPPSYSHVASVTAARWVWTAGAVPLDADGALVGADDRAAQTQQVVANLLAALEEGGAQAGDVVKTTVYVVAHEQAHLLEVWDVVRESPLAGAPSTLLGVAMLGYAGQLVEVEAVAAVAER